MKSELIATSATTQTPLTSILNYSDLLGKMVYAGGGQRLRPHYLSKGLRLKI
ncbi:MAG: hypothetical protein ACLSF2_11725 [Butyricicoccus sp.]